MTWYNLFGRRALGRRCALLVSLLAVAACGGDDPAGPPPARSLQWVVDSLARATNVPGVVVAARRAGREPAVVVSGIADMASRRPVAAADRFRVGSVTKPMVAAVILQLADEGRLALDDPLARFHPDVIPDADRITLRQLLNHTSGLPDYTLDETFAAMAFGDLDRSWTAEELIAFVRDDPRSFAPGAAWRYSNTNYVLLGLVAEAAGGQPLSTLLRTRIFEPLGMSSTYYSAEAAIPPPFAEGYAQGNGTPDFPIGTMVSGTIAGAAGAVVATAGDLLRFVEALADGKLVSPASQAALLAVASGSRGRFPGDPYDTGYGLGVLVGGGWVGHNGAFPGYEAFAMAKPGVGTVVVLLNRSTDRFAALPIWLTIRNRFVATP